ncbi:MAG: hypothetical protein AAF411_22905 [Myxococcota bacterium]
MAAGWPFTVDDAFITLRYGQNLVEHGSYAFNAGDTSDGVTGPLWVLPAALAALAGMPALPKYVGGLCFLGALAVLLRAAGPKRGRVAAYAMVLAPSATIWATGGLETGMATLAFALVLFARRGSWLAAAVIPWLRPELVPAVLAASRTHRDRFALLTGLVSVAVFRVALFGSPIPLSALAKASSIGAGVSYVGIGLLLLSGVVGFELALHGARRGEVDASDAPGPFRLALVVGVHAAAVALAGGDWMPGYRLLIPVLPALALLCAHGLEMRGAKWRSMLGALWFVALAGLSAQQLAPAAESSAGRHGATGVLAERLAGGEGAVAAIDIGFLAYASGREFVDLGGVTDSRVANMRGDHVDREIDVAYLEERGVTDVVLHSVRRPFVQDGRLRHIDGYPTERRLARSEWLQLRFRVAGLYRHAEGYWYVHLTRDSALDSL